MSLQDDLREANTILANAEKYWAMIYNNPTSVPREEYDAALKAVPNARKYRDELVERIAKQAYQGAIILSTRMRRRR